MGGAVADAGRDLRKAVPRSSHAAWSPGLERAVVWSAEQMKAAS